MWRNTAGVFSTALSAASVVGTPCVLSARRIGAAGKTRVNGVDLADQTLSGTYNAHEVGIGFSKWNNSLADQFPGTSTAIAIMRGTVSDADLRLIERYIGSLQGQTL